MPSFPLVVPIPKILPPKMFLSQARSIAENLEKHINEHSKNSATMIFTYAELADVVGFSTEIVKFFLVTIGGGNTGITIHNKIEKPYPTIY